MNRLKAWAQRAWEWTAIAAMYAIYAANVVVTAIDNHPRKAAALAFGLGALVL